MTVESTISFDKAVFEVAKVQRFLSLEGIPSWIGGGIGVDLLREKYLPGEAPREHGDGDLYIPIERRGRTINILKGTQVKLLRAYSSLDVVNIISGEVDVDLISLEGYPDIPWVRKMSAAADILYCQNLAEEYDDLISGVDISTIPDVVDYGGERELYVLNAPSLLAINGLTTEVGASKRARDRRILEKILKLQD